MSNRNLSAGVVHDVPADLAEAIIANSTVSDLWEGLTPLARNEWICWVEDAKKAETRFRRIERLTTEVKAGKRRPCCWPGCRHREKNANGKKQQ